MKKIMLFLLFFVYIDFVSAVHINEIMYNPLGIDNNLEFVEIYGTNNLSYYIIADSASNDSLVLLQFMDSDYSLIVEEGFNLSGINCSVYSVGTTIGDNLNNAGDSVLLYYNGIVVDNVSYNGSLANGNGFSLEFWNDNWVESLVIGGTPGIENHIIVDSHSSNSSNTSQGKDIKLSVSLDDVLFKGLTYTKLFKIENLDDELGIDDNVTVFIYYNITSNRSIVKEDIFNKTINSYSTSNTGSFFANIPGNYTLCGKIINASVNDTNLSNNHDCKGFIVIDSNFIPCNVSLDLSTDKFIYNNSEKINIYNGISNESFPFFIEYWIEDLFGNIIKERYNTSNTASKSYTPDISESDAVFVIKNRLSFIACNNSNKQTENSVVAVVKSRKDPNSSIHVLDIYTGSDNVVKFGEILRVKLDIYKGDTGKSSVEAWLEKNNSKISYVSSFNANKKFTNYESTIPIVIKPNCDMKFKDGKYLLKIEGLGLEVSDEVYVEGVLSTLCKETTVSTCDDSAAATPGKIKQYGIIAFDEKIKQGEALKTTIRIHNIEDEASHYQVWSYIYKGNKCYSGNRTANLIEFDLDQLGTRNITLENSFNGEPGDYKLKVKINKNSQKTDYELTEDLAVEEAENSVQGDAEVSLQENLEEMEKDINSTSFLEDSITGNTVVYESKNTILKNNLSYWIMGVLAIAVFVLIKRS
ncbi:MAG: hypothetical protein ABIE94_06575 [archaeon]